MTAWIFSVWPNPSRTPDEVLDLARMADDDGWLGLWYADHYMPNTGDESFAPGDVHECWSLLPAIAAVTSRIRLGPLVAPTSIHHPALLANRAATIDRLSGGRFVLGLGAGWQINEHAAYGIDLEPPGARVSRFEESIQIVRSLLDNDRTTYTGSFYELTEAPCDPKPVQNRLPILVGTGSPRMLGITARHAQEWNTWGAPDLAAQAAFACSSRRAMPPVPTRSRCTRRCRHSSSWSTTTRRSRRSWRTTWPTGSIAGSDDHLVEQLGRYAEGGFDEVIVPDFTLGDTPAARLEAYRRFTSDIASQL